MILKSHEEYKKFLRHYWQYYRELEDEIIATRRYVDFEIGNFNTYSVEFLKLYQAVCSEIDVLGKTIAHEINPIFIADERQNNIYKWWLILQDGISFPKIDKLTTSSNIQYLPLEEAEVLFFNYIPVKPWHNFRTENRVNKSGANRTELVNGRQVPKWWSDYNSVKHHRTSEVSKGCKEINYSKANLKNVAYSIAALYILEMSYMFAIGDKDDVEAFADDSKLFCKEENVTTSEIRALFYDD